MRTTAVIFATLVLGGCASTDQAGERVQPVEPASQRQELSNGCIGGRTGAVAAEYLGMPAAAGQAKALTLNLRWRVLGEDLECVGVRDDAREDRVNVYVEDGTVVWAAMF